MKLNEGSIRLRALEPEDASLMYIVENDAELWEFGDQNAPCSLSAIKQFIETSSGDVYHDGQLRLAVEYEKETVGFLDLTNIDMHHRRAEVGVVVTHQWQGRGVARTAVQLLINYATELLHLHQLYAYAAEDNLPAQKLFVSADFMHTATLKDWLIRTDGSFKSVLLYQIKLTSG